MDEKEIENGLVESIYLIIKHNAAKRGALTSNGVKALAEMTTELANRLKEEENCDK